METVHSLSQTRSRRSFLALTACGLLFALVGCDTTGAFLIMDGSRYTDPPCQLMTCWEPNVIFTPDPTKNGATNPGMAGRVYLFGTEIKDPLVGDGTLTVDLYDDTGTQGPVMVERWVFKADALKQSLKKDMIGWGYTLFLPSARLTPQMTQVRMKARYDAAKGGTPLFADSGSMALNTGVHKGLSQLTHSANPKTQ